VLKRQSDALELTSSEELELPGRNSVIMQNKEILVRNKEKQSFDLDVAEITSSTVDDNSGTSAAILTP